MGIRTRRWMFYLILFVTLLTACTLPPASPTPTPPPTLPSASLFTAPDLVCGTATQVRLQLQVSHNLPAEDPGAWELIGPEDDPVTQGDWVVRDGAVLIAFPDNAPLPTGHYTLHLRWREEELAAHTFFIGPPNPTIERLDVSVVPGGAAISTLWLEAPLRLFYINYTFEGACTGTPYWISARNAAGDTVCTQNGALEALSGGGTAACYDEGEEPFAPGQYEATMTLPGDITRTVSFEIAIPEATATPPPTPNPQPLSCEESFTALGITPEGEPYLPRGFYDWYTVAIYTGRACSNLQPGTPWHSTWSRRGTVVLETRGVWEGASTGVVWDVLTGVPTNPFVPPGTYTVTLEIGGDISEAAFSIYEYPPASRTE
jgi:hypothetical protein